MRRFVRLAHYYNRHKNHAGTRFVLEAEADALAIEGEAFLVVLPLFNQGEGARKKCAIPVTHQVLFILLFSI